MYISAKSVLRWKSKYLGLQQLMDNNLRVRKRTQSHELARAYRNVCSLHPMGPCSSVNKLCLLKLQIIKLLLITIRYFKLGFWSRNTESKNFEFLSYSVYFQYTECTVLGKGFLYIIQYFSDWHSELLKYIPLQEMH